MLTQFTRVRKLGWVAGLVVCLAAPGSAAAASPAGAGHGDPARAYGERLGTVDFPVSCKPEAARLAASGLALLHHMTYEGSREIFAAASAADPDCAMAYWGEAMTYIHPLWSDPPTEAGFQRASELLATATARGEKTERERAYIAAAESYFAAGRGPVERPNLEAFEKAWQEVHARFPADPEAACFAAISQLGTADPGDKTFAKQRRAGAMTEAVLARIPDHPCGHHYTIHAYDYPVLAERALPVARRYGEIAPAVPHALHMPTHIFTRLGLWQESIDWNRRSGDVALHHPVEGAVSMHHLHALDYLAYAYLQRGQDREAEAVARDLAALAGPFQVEAATPYTFAAVPARLALERQRWAAAAALEPRTPADFPWDKFPALEAITHFARALGAARTGDTAGARKSIDRLAALRDEAQKTSPYWSKQVEIQRLAALAWLKRAEGHEDQALATMEAAAELEATTEKHPVTPGEVLPARELLADMLLEAGQHAEARAAYEATLARSPNRFNALYGAGRAAELAGDREAARRHFEALVANCDAAAAAGERLAHARRFLETRRVGG